MNIKPKLILIFSFILTVSSCSTSKTSKQDLLKENKTLKAKIEALKVNDTSKIEAVVELSYVNVVYRGVSNPVRISFPNSVKINAEGRGLKKIDEFGNYEIFPLSGNTMNITVNAIMADGSKMIDVKSLRIKDIKKHVATINGKRGIIELKKKQIINGEIEVKIEDFLFPWVYNVKGFKIKLVNQNFILVEGNLIPQNLKARINALKQNDVIQILILDLKLKMLQLHYDTKDQVL